MMLCKTCARFTKLDLKQRISALALSKIRRSFVASVDQAECATRLHEFLKRIGRLQLPSLRPTVRNSHGTSWLGDRGTTKIRRVSFPVKRMIEIYQVPMPPAGCVGRPRPVSWFHVIQRNRSSPNSVGKVRSRMSRVNFDTTSDSSICTLYHRTVLELLFVLR